MLEPWMHALTLAAALASSALGFAWLALSMEVHWAQVRGPVPASPRAVQALRVLGVGAIVLSLVLSAIADHATMAALVWVMSLALGAVVVAMVLAWRPRVLSVFTLGLAADAAASPAPTR
jgi:hypothetical protein